MTAFPLYHWSPTSRRRGIEHDGLKPSSRSVDGQWRPPYICYSDSPSMAWALSGQIHPEVPSWDLWMTWSDTPRGYEMLPLDGDPLGRIKEYRIYERIYKRDLWYVGSRA